MTDDILTQEEREDLKYFWQNRGDLERLSTFESLKPKIQKELPSLLKAWEDYKAIKQTLDIITNSL